MFQAAQVTKAVSLVLMVLEYGISYKINSSLTLLNVSLDSLQAFCLRSAYCYALLTQGRLS